MLAILGVALSTTNTAAASPIASEAEQNCPDYYFWDYGKKSGLRVKTPNNFSHSTLLVWSERCNKAALDWSISGENVGRVVFLYFFCDEGNQNTSINIGAPYYDDTSPSSKRTSWHWSKCGNHKDYMPVSHITQVSPVPQVGELAKSPTRHPSDYVISPNFTGGTNCDSITGGRGINVPPPVGGRWLSEICAEAIEKSRQACNTVKMPSKEATSESVISWKWKTARRIVEEGYQMKANVYETYCAQGKLHLGLNLQCLYHIRTSRIHRITTKEWQYYSIHTAENNAGYIAQTNESFQAYLDRQVNLKRFWDIDNSRWDICGHD